MMCETELSGIKTFLLLLQVVLEMWNSMFDPLYVYVAHLFDVLYYKLLIETSRLANECVE